LSNVRLHSADVWLPTANVSTLTTNVWQHLLNVFEHSSNVLILLPHFLENYPGELKEQESSIYHFQLFPKTFLKVLQYSIFHRRLFFYPIPY
jgi:hypothetical protein